MSFLSQLDWATIADFLLAAIVGTGVSAGELIARYRDEPWATLRSAPAAVYMLVNAAASMIALTIVRALGLNFGATGEGVRLAQVMVAGLGAMAIFRSAFFTVRVGKNDVPVGAASFLQVVLDAADREVDRRRATLRAATVRRIMEGISFEKAMTALPVYSIQLMQNLSNEQQAQLATDVNKLLELESVEEAIKAQMLGLAVMNFLGEDVLDASVQALRKQIVEGDGTRQASGTEARPAKKISDLWRGFVSPKEEEQSENSGGEGQELSPPPISATKKPAGPRFNIDELVSKAKETAEQRQSSEESQG